MNLKLKYKDKDYFIKYPDNFDELLNGFKKLFPGEEKYVNFFLQ